MPAAEEAVLDERVVRVHGDVVVAGGEVDVVDEKRRPVHVHRIRVV